MIADIGRMCKSIYSRRCIFLALAVHQTQNFALRFESNSFHKNINCSDPRPIKRPVNNCTPRKLKLLLEDAAFSTAPAIGGPETPN